MGGPVTAIPRTLRGREACGRRNLRRRGPRGQDGQVDSLGSGGGGGGEAEPGLVKSSLTNHHRLVVFSLLSFVRGTHTPRLAHSAGWGRRISYVWASTQGRQPVSFIIVHIPLRGEWILNENKTNKSIDKSFYSVRPNVLCQHGPTCCQQPWRRHPPRCCPHSH
jgi:hypothetical protein